MAFKKIAFFGILLLCFSCGKTPSPVATKPTVLVSIAPYAFFVNEIGGGNVTVQTLVPEGANPHIYEPKPKEVAAIQKANLWIRLGEASEEKILKVLTEQNSHLKVVKITDGLKLLSCHEHHHDSCHEHHHDHEDSLDLHVWLSPKLVKKQAEVITQALIQLDPEHQSAYAHNLATFLVKLTLLDQDLKAEFEASPVKTFLISHPALAYLCQDYGLTQLSIEIEGKDPLPRQITALMQTIAGTSLKTVFLEPQYSTKGAKLIADELHLKTETIDPYAENYLENMRTIAKLIAEG